MIPIILFTLGYKENTDERVYLSSLKSFEILLYEAFQKENKFLESYTSDILKKLLFMCQYQNNMNIRLQALKCLNDLATRFSPNKLIQFQKHVCKSLEPCLNDKKRLCRQRAVEARNKWYILHLNILV
jgi:hypothetical protein